MQTLNDIILGSAARVISVEGRADMKRRLHDIGLVKGTKVRCIGESPCGDPRAYCIRGAVIALRSEDCKCIFVG